MPQEAQKTTSSRPARRNPRHERNRDRLIEAGIGILLGEGMTSFTSTHIADAAGLHKPAFYAHFKNVDECLSAIALQVAQADMRESMTLHGSIMETLPPDLERSRLAIERELRTVHEHARMYQLLLRYRHADGPLGDAMRAIDSYVYERWTEYFWRLAVFYGIDAKHFREIAQLAEHIVSITYFGIERVVTGRVQDIAAEAARLQRYNEALLRAEMRRMLGSPADPSI